MSELIRRVVASVLVLALAYCLLATRVSLGEFLGLYLLAVAATI